MVLLTRMLVNLYHFHKQTVAAVPQKIFLLTWTVREDDWVSDHFSMLNYGRPLLCRTKVRSSFVPRQYLFSIQTKLTWWLTYLIRWNIISPEAAIVKLLWTLPVNDPVSSWDPERPCRNPDWTPDVRTSLPDQLRRNKTYQNILQDMKETIIWHSL